MSVVCPTITASSAHDFRAQTERVAAFAHRIHIDLADGVFTENKLIALEKVWWPAGVTADVHLMYEAVKPFIPQLTSLHPHMVIVHAEAVGNYYKIARPLKKAGIKVGVALLSQTPVDIIRGAISDIDHVLIFSGHLGHFGGHVDLSLTKKIAELKKLRSDIEIGWDGGISEKNIVKLTASGVDVLNVGGAVQRAKNPAEAYATLKALAE